MNSIQLGSASCVASLVLSACATSYDSALVRERTQALLALHDLAADQEPPAPPELGEAPDLIAYLAYGLRRNPRLRAAYERWRAGLERIAQVSTLPDPVLSWSHFIEDVQTRTGAQRNRFGLAQSFPWFGKLDTAGAVEAAEAEGLWARVESRRLGVGREIARAYHEYSFLAQAIRITKDNLGLLQRLEPVAQRKIQAGGSQVDLLRLQVEIGKIENDLASLAQRRPVLNARLCAVLNRSERPLLPMPGAASPSTFAATRDELLRRLGARNPELAELHAAIDGSERRRELAELSGWPDVTLRVDYFETGDAIAPTPGSGDDPLAIGVMFNLPIWRGKYDAAVRAARRGGEAVRRELTDRKNRLRADLEVAVYAREDAARQVALYRSTLLPRARQSFEVTQASYRTGAASLLDVIDAERVLLTFDKAYWRAVRDHEQAIADIEALCGGDSR